MPCLLTQSPGAELGPVAFRNYAAPMFLRSTAKFQKNLNKTPPPTATYMEVSNFARNPPNHPAPGGRVRLPLSLRRQSRPSAQSDKSEFKTVRQSSQSINPTNHSSRQSGPSVQSAQSQ